MNNADFPDPSPNPPEVAAPPPSPQRRSWLRRMLGFPWVVLGALLVLFEELVWNKVEALVALLARWRLIARLETRILTLGRYPTLALFALPMLALLPVKLLALYLIAHGRVALGVGVIVAAKVVGTALSARLFVLAKPKLMTFPLFVRIYNKVLQFKRWAHANLDRWGVTSRLRAMKERIKAGWGGLKAAVNVQAARVVAAWRRMMGGET
ncbi:MAG: hypothetical protein HQL51_13350 [Magnetococcales bacterium]|nr:hypothetical protein [Magnetococcales bacterium]